MTKLKCTCAALVVLTVLITSGVLVHADDDFDLPLYVATVLAKARPWANTTKSHFIPLTYGAFDLNFYQCRAVQVDDGYWLGLYDPVPNELQLLKTDLAGRTMIPPFKLAVLPLTYDTDWNHHFVLVPGADGGLTVLTTEKSPTGDSDDPALLREYRLDGFGVIQSARTVLTERRLYSDKFNSFKAAATADGGLVFATKSDTGLFYGVVPATGEARYWEVVPDGTGISCFDLALDASSGDLFIAWSTNSGYLTYFDRWDLNGVRSVHQNVTTYTGDIWSICPYRLLMTKLGVLMTLPKGSAVDLAFLILDRNGSVVRQKSVPGLKVAPDTGDVNHDLAMGPDGVIRLVYSVNNDLFYAVFDLSGRLLVPKLDLADVADYSYTTMHPFVFVDGRRTTVFYSHSVGGIRNLAARHLVYDFSSGQPDLVVSVPHLEQSPNPAFLDAAIGLRATVYNRGEAASDQAQLTITYRGQEYKGTVNALSPGQSQTLEFADLPTPEYLDETPLYQVAVADGQFSGNNQVTAKVRYPGRTPIYPPGSALYTWVVRDKATHALLEYVNAALLLPQVETADGQVQDVGVVNDTNSDGEFQTRLPAGTYTFHLYKNGYPPTDCQVTVPDPDTATLELEPPGNLLLALEDSHGGDLHPAPNAVSINLEHQDLDYQYYGRGNESGLALNDLMPGRYDYVVQAFGYVTATGTLDITGGQDNKYTVVLTPGPRCSITGRVVSSTSGLVGAAVSLDGTGLGAICGADGYYLVDDLPYGQYRISASKDGYATRSVSHTVDASCLNPATLDLPSVADAFGDLGHWTLTAWNKVEEVPGTFFTANYKVTVTYGVFDLDGGLYYTTVGDEAYFNYLDLTINGWKWYYYSVSTSFSLLDLAFSGLDDIVDGAGDLAGLLVDQYDSGFFDFLELSVGAGGSGGQTIVRVDRVALYEGDTVLDDSHETLRQDYSINGAMGFPLSGHALDLSRVRLRIYMKVMNENYSIGPLYLMDKIMVEWRFDGENLALANVVQNPPNYPTFSD